MHLDRNSVGYEINADFMHTIKEKLCDDISVKNGDSVVVFSQDGSRDYSYQTLPYLFQGPFRACSHKELAI